MSHSGKYPSFYLKYPARRGFSLVEAVIILGVVGLVLGGLWAASVSVRQHYRNSEISKTVVSVVQNIRASLPVEVWPSSSGEANITSTVARMKLIPETWIRGTSLISPDGLTTNVYLGYGTVVGLTRNIRVRVSVPTDSDAEYLIKLLSSNAQINYGLYRIQCYPNGSLAPVVAQTMPCSGFFDCPVRESAAGISIDFIFRP